MAASVPPAVPACCMALVPASISPRFTIPRLPAPREAQSPQGPGTPSTVNQQRRGSLFERQSDHKILSPFDVVYRFPGFELDRSFQVGSLKITRGAGTVRGRWTLHSRRGEPSQGARTLARGKRPSLLEKSSLVQLGDGHPTLRRGERGRSRAQ